MSSFISILRGLAIYTASVFVLMLSLVVAIPDYAATSMIAIILVPPLITWFFQRSVKKRREIYSKTGTTVGILGLVGQRNAEAIYQNDVRRLFDEVHSVQIGSLEDWEKTSRSLRDRVRDDSENMGRLRQLDLQVKIKNLVKTHMSPLQRSMEKAIVRNEYGAIIENRRFEEISRFLLSVGFSDDQSTSLACHSTVESALEEFSQQLTAHGFDPNALPENGLEFEGWVAANLRRFGWDASATIGSGDQGVDVIAKKSGVTVGIQCKLYGSNVGNKAVQEIIAAKAYFDFDVAVVLSNAGYTKSALDLAQKSGVSLLSQHDIPRFDRLFLRSDTAS